MPGLPRTASRSSWPFIGSICQSDMTRAYFSFFILASACRPRHSPSERTRSGGKVAQRGPAISTIAFNCGSVPELITHGTSGFIVENMEDAVRAVPRVASLDRAACRQAFEMRFTGSRMAKDYVKLYESMLNIRALSVETSEVDTFLTQ